MIDLTVVVPHVPRMLHPDTERTAREHVPPGIPLEFADTSADDEHYWRVLAGLWARPGSTLIIEQDIGIRAGVVEELAACPEPWCGFPYPLHKGVLLTCLGCTRFSGQLKAAEPDLLAVVGLKTGDGLPPKDWRRLDVRLGDELRMRGYEVHEHQPPVAHFHDYGKQG